jgi:hypothetical protein
MTRLVSSPKSAQSVPIGALFFWPERAPWAREQEEIPKDLIGWSSSVAPLREPSDAILTWQETGGSTVGVYQTRTEKPERLYTFVADPEVFDDYDLTTSSATSLARDEADLLEQFDESWPLDALDRAQGRFFVGKEISDEMIATGMLEHDFVVQMSPIREYTLRVRIKSIEKATPHIVGPEDI